MKKLTFVIIVVIGIIGFINIKTTYKEQTITRDDLVEYYRVDVLESKYEELEIYDEDENWIKCYGYNDGEFAGACSFNRTFYENQYMRQK